MNRNKQLNESSNDSPKVYVASLSDYNEGKLAGEWFDLTDYSDGSDLMSDIADMLKRFDKKIGLTLNGPREEYAVHDYENFPSNYYSEYMGEEDFDQIINAITTAENSNLPLEILMDAAEGDDIEEVATKFRGHYDSAEDFAYETEDDSSAESLLQYWSMTETDIRVYSTDMANADVADKELSELEDYFDEDNFKKELLKQSKAFFSAILRKPMSAEDADDAIEGEPGIGIIVNEVMDRYFESKGDFDVITFKIAIQEFDKLVKDLDINDLMELANDAESYSLKGLQEYKWRAFEELESELSDEYQHAMEKDPQGFWEDQSYSVEEIVKMGYINYQRMGEDYLMDYTVVDKGSEGIYVFENF